MFCQSCPATIKKKLSAQSWVTAVDADLDSKTAMVTVNDPKITAQNIIDFIAVQVGLEGAIWINDPNQEYNNDKSKRAIFGCQ
jgi:copper chaperone CopZ